MIRTTIRSDKHPRAAGHGRAIAAAFANHGGRFAGDGRFVDRGDALDHFAVAGNVLAGFDDHVISLAQGRGGHFA